MKYLYILKIFFFKKDGKFRTSYLLPIFSITIGSYMIFMILCIMNSMEEQINMRLNSLHYKYYMNHNYSAENIIVNKGLSKLGFPDKNNDAILYIHGIENFDTFKKNKINSYLISYVDSSEYDFFIGDEFATLLGVSLNDTIKMYYPSDINIVFNEIPHINHIVTGIFDTDFLNYDSNTILASLNSFNTSNDANYRYYFDSEDPSILNIDYKYNSYLDGIIIDALNIEKKLYYVFGLFVIVIACFMFFLTLAQSINEKRQQIYIMRSLGSSVTAINLIMLFNTIISGILISIFSLFLVNITLYMNINYGFFKFLFSSVPFKSSYILINDFETITLLVIIGILLLFSTYVSLLQIKRFELNNNANT